SLAFPCTSLFRSALQLCPAVVATLVAQAGELAEAGLEDRLQPADNSVAVGGGRVQLDQVRAGPEPVLEFVRFLVGALEGAQLAENDYPADQGPGQQQQDDQLDRQARAQHQVQVVDAAVGDAGRRVGSRRGRVR